MNTPNDGTNHTDDESHAPHDQRPAANPASEYMIGAPGCHLCSAMKKEVPSRSLEEQTPNLQRVLQAVDQKRRRMWSSMGLDPGPPRVSNPYPPEETDR